MVNPFWAAIGEPDNRFRKPTAQGRMIERVMLLDAVLEDREFTWLGPSIDYRLKPLIERFGDRAIADIKTADIDDFVADLKQPRVVNGLDSRRLTPASINRTLELLRHILNWAVGREYLDRTQGCSPENITFVGTAA